MNNLKTIVFFSRCNLVHLYGQLSSRLNQSFNLVHIAYSNEEAKILRENYDIEPLSILTNEVEELYKNEQLDIPLCNEIDELIIRNSASRFNLASSIQSDRSFSELDFSTVRILCQVYYKYWMKHLSTLENYVVIHEPTSLYLNHICALICSEQEGRYISPIMSYGIEKNSFLFVSGDDCKFDASVNPQKIRYDKHQISKFLNEFRQDFRTFADNLSDDHLKFTKVLSDSIKLTAKWILSIFKFMFKKYSATEHLQKFHDEYSGYFEQIYSYWYQYFKVKYDTVDSNEKYYYYPMHLEPEAVVLYWADGLYTGQVKAIENIARQMPPDTYLVVKDHPHGGAYRSIKDYLKIMSIPNVKLIAPNYSGKKLIAKSQGVITLNGTSGFEALLLGKPVYCLGNAFYEQFAGVVRLNCITELKEAIYLRPQIESLNDEDVFEIAFCYLNNTYGGFISYFGDYVQRYKIDENANTDLVAESFKKYFLE